VLYEIDRAMAFAARFAEDFGSGERWNHRQSMAGIERDNRSGG
jgi:hypothetical protein